MREAAWLALCLALGCIACAPAEATGITVGSGAIGITDGDAARASFVMPMGVAFGSDGTLYIADAGAQRIRRLAHSSVGTLAGGGPLEHDWVRGDLRDGPARSARFNRPRALALGADGSLYIADAGNYRIRRLFHGEVTSFAGSSRGTRDGDRREAQFSDLHALAADGDGRLFVADGAGGLRRIDPSGAVTTVHLPVSIGNRIIGVGTRGVGSEENIVVTGERGLVVFRPSDQSVLHAFGAGQHETDFGFGNLVMSVPAGWPAAVALSPFGEIVASDVRNRVVRYYWNETLSILAGDNSEDAANGWHENGAARFPASLLAPTGIALGADRRMAVADAGARRILLDTLPPFPTLYDPAAPLAVAEITDRYRIAYVGNSYVNYGARVNESIQEKLESALGRSMPASGLAKPPLVVPIPKIEVQTLAAQSDYVKTVLSEASYDLVIWQVNSPMVKLQFGWYVDSYIDAIQGPWETQITDQIRAAAMSLKARGIALVVVLNPYPFDVSNVESIWGHEYRLYPQQSFYADTGERLHRAIANAGVDLIDTYPDFLNHYRVAHPAALFGTRDAHFTPAANTLVANRVFAELMRLRPWTHP